MKKSVTVSEFLLARLHELGVRHIFGFPAITSLISWTGLWILQ
ncbi:MAG: hypothetical protein NT118_12705 [Lentisphaerae bacterium]|nr:hypothetical protein [Lentisphaerota bacterium]